MMSALPFYSWVKFYSREVTGIASASDLAFRVLDGGKSSNYEDTIDEAPKPEISNYYLTLYLGKKNVHEAGSVDCSGSAHKSEPSDSCLPFS